MAKGSRGGRRSGGSGASIAQQLRDDMEDMYDPDVTDAIKLYISDSNPNGDGYSHSQI